MAVTDVGAGLAAAAEPATSISLDPNLDEPPSLPFTQSKNPNKADGFTQQAVAQRKGSAEVPPRAFNSSDTGPSNPAPSPRSSPIDRISKEPSGRAAKGDGVHAGSRRSTEETRRSPRPRPSSSGSIRGAYTSFGAEQRRGSGDSRRTLGSSGGTSGSGSVGRSTLGYTDAGAGLIRRSSVGGAGSRRRTSGDPGGVEAEGATIAPRRSTPPQDQPLHRHPLPFDFRTPTPSSSQIPSAQVEAYSSPSLIGPFDSDSSTPLNTTFSSQSISAPATVSESGSGRSRPTSPPPPPADFNPAPSFPTYTNPISPVSPVSRSSGGSVGDTSRSGSRQGSLGTQSILAFGAQTGDTDRFGDLQRSYLHGGDGHEGIQRIIIPGRDRNQGSGSSASASGSGDEGLEASPSFGDPGRSARDPFATRPAMIAGLSTLGSRGPEERTQLRGRSRGSSREPSPAAVRMSREATIIGGGSMPSSPMSAHVQREAAMHASGSGGRSPFPGRTFSSRRSSSAHSGPAEVDVSPTNLTSRSDRFMSTSNSLPARPLHRQMDSTLSAMAFDMGSGASSSAATITSSGIDSVASHHLEEARSAINNELEEALYAIEDAMSPGMTSRRESRPVSPFGGRISPRRSFSDGTTMAAGRSEPVSPRRGLDRRETSPVGVHTLTTSKDAASREPTAPAMILGLKDEDLSFASSSTTIPARPVVNDDTRWGSVRGSRRSPQLTPSGIGMNPRAVASAMPELRGNGSDGNSRSSFTFSDDAQPAGVSDNVSARLWDSVWPADDRGHHISAMSPTMPADPHEGTLPLHIRSLSTSVVMTTSAAPRLLGTMMSSSQDQIEADGSSSFISSSPPSGALSHALALTRGRDRRGSLAVSHTWPPGRPFPQAGMLDEINSPSTFSSMGSDGTDPLLLSFPKNTSPSMPQGAIQAASPPGSPAVRARQPRRLPSQATRVVSDPALIRMGTDVGGSTAANSGTRASSATFESFASLQDRDQTPSPPKGNGLVEPGAEGAREASVKPAAYHLDSPNVGALSPKAGLPSIPLGAESSPPLLLPPPQGTAFAVHQTDTHRLPSALADGIPRLQPSNASPKKAVRSGKQVVQIPPAMHRSTSHIGSAARPMSPLALVTRPRSYSGGHAAPSPSFSATLRASPRSEPGQNAIGSPPGATSVFEEFDSSQDALTPNSRASSHSSNGKSSSGSSSGRPSGSSGEADDESSPPRATSVLGSGIDEQAALADSADAQEEVPSFLDPPSELESTSTAQSTAAAGEDGDLEVDEAMVEPTDAFPMEMAFEDEGLTTLERIFLLSKSEFAFHRAYIARMLGDLLEDVDPCETVEYVIPLLNGFAVDEDESVKEAFASDLHRIMWHFFSTCRIMDDSGIESPEVLLPAHEPIDTPGQVVTITSEGIRTVRKPTLEGLIAELGATASAAETIEESSTISEAARRSTTMSTDTATNSTPGTLSTPGTFVDTPNSTMSSNPTTVSETTAISPAEIVNPLGAGVGEVVKEAGPLVGRPSIAVHVFTPMLGSMLLSQNSLVADPTRAAVVSVLAKLRGQEGPLSWIASDHSGQRRTYMSQAGVHQHDVYPFSRTAKGMIERELLTEIVLGIGRLDSEIAEAAALQRTQSRMTSDGEEQIDAGMDSPPTSASGDRPGLSRTISRSSSTAYGGEKPEGTGTDGSLTSSEAALFKLQLAQEAMLGRAISMNLLASVAEFYSEDEIERYQFIPQVLLTAVDEPGVKTEAALALAYLAKHAATEAIDSLLELFESFAGDPIDQVRQAACLCLPALAKRITDQSMKRDYVVEAYTNLVYSGDLVQYTSLEILGEIIHLFHDDPDGTPVDLLEVFLSQASEHEEVDSFTAEVTAGAGVRTFSQYRREFDDLDRAAISAFNFPAVCLALGRPGWFQIRQTYRALCNINHPRVTRSLAGSIHEVAKIIGPDLAASDLLEPFYEFLHGSVELQERILQNISSFVRAIPASEALDTIRLLSTEWETGSFKNWRHREILAGQAAGIFESQSLDAELGGACIELLRSFLFDAYEAVRLAAVQRVPACFKVVSSDPQLAQSLLDLLHELGGNTAFKRRRTFMSCLSAFIEQGIDIAFFEENFMRYLTPLSDDMLDVRIGLAHLVSRLCSSGGLYADVVARSLALAEVIERLRNDDSPYVRKPLESVHPKPMPMYQNPSGGWHGPLGDVFTPGQASGTSSGGTPGGRRSSSASMILARAESDTTVLGVRNIPLDSAGTGESFAGFSADGRPAGAQSAPASYRSPEIWYSPHRVRRRRWLRGNLSEHSARGSTPDEVPVQVGMRDIFDASFKQAVVERGIGRERESHSTASNGQGGSE